MRRRGKKFRFIATAVYTNGQYTGSAGLPTLDIHGSNLKDAESKARAIYEEHPVYKGLVLDGMKPRLQVMDVEAWD